MIDKGHIVERGTHETLLAKGGVYKKLVLRQLSVSQHENLSAGDLDPNLLGSEQPSVEEVEEP